MLAEESLEQNFHKVLNLPQDATQWLLALWRALQFFDDIADGDDIDRETLDTVLWDSLVGFYSDPFLSRYSSILIPLISTMILKWQASDTVERDGKPCAMSFGWRAGYYDIVLAVVQIIHGTEIATKSAHIVMSLYGENYTEYLEEFSNA